MKARLLLLLGALATALAGCGSPGRPSASSDAEKPLVFFAQANSADPWRQVFDRETKDAADRYSGYFRYEEQQADDDASKQIGIIETAMVKQPKVLLVSPATAAVESAIAKAHEAGAFVILLDRGVPGDKYDVRVGGDNRAIGFQAGQYMAKRLDGKGTVLMIRGIADADPTTQRAAGFMDAMKKAPGIHVIVGDDCGYQRQRAQTYMENFLQSGKTFDAVYAHNDEMAIGAYQAMKAAHTPKKVIVGIDGCQQEMFNYIKDGEIDATFTYPDPGPKGIEIAADFIKDGKRPTTKLIILQTTEVTQANAEEYMASHRNLAK